MKIQKKYNVNLTDGGYNFAQYDFGTLREVLDGEATIWYSRDDDVYYTIDREVAAFYEDLEDALQNLAELQEALSAVYLRLYKHDAGQMIADWIADHFYYVIDDAAELIRRFARWEDARDAFVEMIAKMTRNSQALEEFKRAV